MRHSPVTSRFGVAYQSNQASETVLTNHQADKRLSGSGRDHQLLYCKVNTTNGIALMAELEVINTFLEVVRTTAHHLTTATTLS